MASRADEVCGQRPFDYDALGLVSLLFPLPVRPFRERDTIILPGFESGQVEFYCMSTVRKNVSGYYWLMSSVAVIEVTGREIKKC